MIPKAKILEHKGRAVGARSERRRRPRERERGASAHARRGRGIRPLCSPLRPAPGAVSGLPAVALPRICHLSPAAAHACQLVPLRRASSVVHSFWRVRSCAPDRIVPSSTETAPYRASTTHRAHAKRHFRLRFYDMWRRFVSVSPALHIYQRGERVRAPVRPRDWVLTFERQSCYKDGCLNSREGVRTF